MQKFVNPPKFNRIAGIVNDTPVPPAQVLNHAINQRVSPVVVVGTDANGQFFISSSHSIRDSLKILKAGVIDLEERMK